jgi:hypothetical protein
MGTLIKFPNPSTSINSWVLSGIVAAIGPKPQAEKLAGLQLCALAILAFSKPSGAAAVVAAALVINLEKSRRDMDFMCRPPVVTWLLRVGPLG